MHEQAIARDIIEKAGKHGKVVSLSVECGQLAHLTAAEMETALKSLASFDVHVSETPAVVECTCGFTGKPKIVLHSHDALVFFCPDCGSVPKIIKGDKIVLAKVTVE